MSRAILVIMFALSAAAHALSGESRVDDTLFIAARKSLPQDIATNEVVRVLQTGLWNSNRTAVAISLSKPKASIIFVFLRQTNGTYLAVDARGVEAGNFGKLGIAGRAGYDRFETTPIQWLPREDGWFQVVMRTRAWKAGKRYTVSEPLTIRSDGYIGWR
ncbi:MAG: hypothetical protein HY298_19085 [Verrucomicrobia bacterium]|nr:hypothetical protein [Verrucomicrobiota bacterium]